MRSIVGSILSLIILAFMLGAYKIGARDAANLPIESKTPIEPDLHIVVSGGELDTTFIYRRNP